MSGYASAVRILIAKLLLLASLLLMPLGMAPAAADAAQHPGTMASMPVGHCADEDSSHSPKSGIAECMMACAAALPAAEMRRERPLLIASRDVAIPVSKPLRGLHPGPATPPPKRS